MDTAVGLVTTCFGRCGSWVLIELPARVAGGATAPVLGLPALQEWIARGAARPGTPDG